MGIIALGAATFFKRMETADYEARAKTTAISEMSLVLNSMERDFKLRDITAQATKDPICPGLCKDFFIDRRVKVGGGEGNLKIHYRTVCSGIPGSMTGKFTDPMSLKTFDFTAAGSTTDSAAPGACLRMSGCKGNTYPQVRVDLAAPGGASLPNYPRISGNTALFPDLKATTSASSSVIAAAVCAESKMGAGMIGSDRVTIESAFINAQGKLRVEKREISIPRSNVAKIQILPAN